MGLEARGIQQNAQHLRVDARGPARQEKEGGEHDQPAQKASEQVECRAAHNEGQEEQPALDSPDRERFVDGLIDRMKSWFVRHGSFLPLL